MTTSREPKDNVFDFQGKPVSDFRFDQTVATVFDDMVSRSVPYYGEIHRMCAELAGDFAREGSNVYDIGCSTGTSLIAFDKTIQAPDVTLIGVDNSQEMLKRADEKLKSSGLRHPYVLEYGDLNKGIAIQNASVISMILTLQFVRPLNREMLMKQMFEGLRPGGVLLLVEKLTSEHTVFNRLFIQHYYEFKKRNGYSEMEIANKREALENVLIPYRMEENFDLLNKVGFGSVEVFFRWYNFCAIIAIKD